ncbi:MAG: NADH-quinone oxidoreductase subunit B, partial [Moorea sp. SIO4A3]|nr:NADH-quinone oxidoreductase subunit B [Moorena sp. SIO4A3]
DAIVKLRKKVANESIQERGQLKQTHRYYSTTHNMKVVPEILTGKYLQSEERYTAPKQLTEGMGIAVPPALKSYQKQEVERG